MKLLSAGLTFCNASTVCALILGLMAGGLGPGIAWFSLGAGVAAALVAFLFTWDPGDQEKPAEPENSSPFRRYRKTMFWIVAAVFALFAFRSFCWLLYTDGDQLMIQSPNNLGDLALHITYIKDFANGTPMWPNNPIFPVGKLRYPAGMDFFNAILVAANIDLIRGLVWAGLLASAATFYAFYRWGGLFSVSGFLFNGGVAGFAILSTRVLADYQGDKTIAWKSLALSMFVTQRGLLYAIPAGLLLLWQWRERYFRQKGRAPLPFWLELSLYATMPLFHVHTFLALSIVLLFLFVFVDPARRGQMLTLVAAALIPATFFVYLITDHFHASSIMQWKPGWVLADPEFGRSNFVIFWWDNFGFLGPLTLALFGFCGWRAWKNKAFVPGKIEEDVAFLFPAAVILIISMLVKLAPWEWDNLKVMVWAYFIILPYLWRYLVQPWELPLRAAICLGLFGSGFITLLGGLSVGRPGFGFASRAELAGTYALTHGLPLDARFAAYPTYNHPLLLVGRNVILGYPGHLWTQGFTDYGMYQTRLTNLMLGRGDWLKEARWLGARYIFWGREEKQNYENNPSGPKSSKPWEAVMSPIISGPAGDIYDIEQAPPGG